MELNVPGLYILLSSKNEINSKKPLKSMSNLHFPMVFGSLFNDSQTRNIEFLLEISPPWTLYLYR